MGSKPGDPKPCSLRSCSCRQGSLPYSDPYVSLRLYLAAQQKVPQEVGSSLALVQPAPDSGPQVPLHLVGSARFMLLQSLPPSSRRLGPGSASSVLHQEKEEFPGVTVWSPNRIQKSGLEGLELLISKKSTFRKVRKRTVSCSPSMTAALNALRCFRGDVVTLFS